MEGSASRLCRPHSSSDLHQPKANPEENRTQQEISRGDEFLLSVRRFGRMDCRRLIKRPEWDKHLRQAVCGTAKPSRRTERSAARARVHHRWSVLGNEYRTVGPAIVFLCRARLRKLVQIQYPRNSDASGQRANCIAIPASLGNGLRKTKAVVGSLRK